MDFKISIKLTDEDYYAFNDFCTFCLPHGKKQILGYRIFLTSLVVLIYGIYLLSSNYSVGDFLMIIPFAIMLTVLQITFKPLCRALTKKHVRELAKKGKKLYSPESEMEFYEDGFTEITPEVRSEVKYSLVERVSVILDRSIYIHVNQVTAFIVPMSAFESKEECGRFIEFLRLKSPKVDIIDIYGKK